jgi:Tfp pilus assembly protein PilO
MKRLPPAKRNQLIMVILATLAALFLVYYLLIAPQKAENTDLANKIRVEREKLTNIKDSIKGAEKIAANLADSSDQLSRAEEDVATGDVYAWTYDTIRRFKAPYRVDIPSIGQPTVQDMDMLAGFPYRQVKVNIMGTAFYHDLGKFVSDFENAYPHMRIENISIEPANMTGPNADKLSFRMDIVALIKPNS